MANFSNVPEGEFPTAAIAEDVVALDDNIAEIAPDPIALSLG